MHIVWGDFQKMSVRLCSKAATLVAALHVIAVLFHNLMFGCCKLSVQICTNTTDLQCISAENAIIQICTAEPCNYWLAPVALSGE